jgi:hypothetical protein
MGEKRNGVVMKGSEGWVIAETMSHVSKFYFFILL